MTSMDPGACTVVRPDRDVIGKQGLDYAVGISAATAGARGLHLQTVTIAPGARSKAHKHPSHETAICAILGLSGCWYGDALQHHAWVGAGEFFYIPPDVPHMPYNPSDSADFVAVIARTDPNEQEHVVLLPELDGLPHVEAGTAPPRSLLTQSTLTSASNT